MSNKYIDKMVRQYKIPTEKMTAAGGQPLKEKLLKKALSLAQAQRGRRS